MIDTAVILAAGRGSRLGEITRARSKAMVPVVGRPMIQRVIDELSEGGIRRFIVVAAPADAELKSYFAGCSNVTVLEQREPRGSGDALRVCAGHVSGTFMVSACDSLVGAADIRALCVRHREQGARLTIGVVTVSPETSLEARSVVRLVDNRVVDFIEKPGPGERISDVTALPLYVCTDDIFERLERLAPSPRGEYELPAVFSQLCKGGELVVASEVSERHDVTNSIDLLALNMLFLQKLAPSVVIDPSARIAAAVKLVPPVWVGPGCVVEQGATLGPSVYLEQQVSVAAGASVERVVALRGSTVTGRVAGVVVTP